MQSKSQKDKPSKHLRQDPVLQDQGGRMTASDPIAPTTDEAVRRRAYELYEKRGKKDGQDLKDWFTAESQIP